MKSMVPQVVLSNGIQMPQLGLGVMHNRSQEQMDKSVKAAIDAGCRSFDNAGVYGNEKEFGIALKKSGIARDEVFITTKIRNSQQEYDNALKAFEEQRKALDLEYVDLYLIHWPCPEFGKYTEAWKAMEKLYKDGLIRAIGVSNFFVKHLQTMLDICEVPPMIDQIQTHPQYFNDQVWEFCKKNGIQMEAWCPLGHGEVLKNPKLVEIGDRYGKTSAQATLRWHMQKGIVAIPGSTNPTRIAQSMDVFDFELSSEEMSAIDELNIMEAVGGPPGAPKHDYDPDMMNYLF